MCPLQPIRWSIFAGASKGIAVMINSYSSSLETAYERVFVSTDRLSILHHRSEAQGLFVEWLLESGLCPNFNWEGGGKCTAHVIYIRYICFLLQYVP